MTLGMLEALVNSAIRALEGVSVAEHYVGLMIIVCILGIGSAYAITIVAKDYSFDFLSNLIL